MTGQEFSERYLPLGEGLFRVAYALLGAEADAEDALQDLYVKLWNDRDTLDHVHNPRAYSITLLRNLCLDRLRAKFQYLHTRDVHGRSFLDPYTGNVV